MPEDRDLITQLEHALRPGPVQPPEARLQAFRRLVTRRAPLRVIPDGHATRAASSSPTSPRSEMPEPSRRLPGGDRRLVMAFSGAAAALILFVAATVALSGVRGTSGPSEQVLRVQHAAYRVQAALDRKDPVAVAKADAELLRAADQLDGQDRADVQRIAVPVHLQAVAFLRENASPEVLSDVPGGLPSRDGQTPSGLDDLTLPTRPPLPTVPGIGEVPAPAGPVDVPPLDGVSTSTVPRPVDLPSLTITGVTPRLDGAFEVNFSASGFTPDASGASGSYAIRFSYDGGVEPTLYTGESPWTFPLLKAIQHQQVCGEIVDSSGSIVTDSRTCTNIINL